MIRTLFGFVLSIMVAILGTSVFQVWRERRDREIIEDLDSAGLGEWM